MSISSFGMRRVLAAVALTGGAALAVCAQGGAATRTVFAPTSLSAQTAAGHVRAPFSIRRNVNSGNPAIYGFPGAPNGATPYSGLVDIKGVLYGTTDYGGKHNVGAVFSITPGGSEKILYSFPDRAGCSNPFGGLINVGGTLYGTTEFGGSGGGNGCVFSIKPSGKEAVLYSFVRGGTDGYAPLGRLLYYNGALYGTTANGGDNAFGTVFEVPLTGGQDTILYSFKQLPDGSTPEGGLVYHQGAFYGTTYAGGASRDGTVYKVTMSGTETVLHSFSSEPDGSNPMCELLNIGDAFYGTTPTGGSGANSGGGTVFKVTSNGQETVLHSFDESAGLYQPFGGLIDVNGMLYGTGGSAFKPGGAGGIYSIAPSGTETDYYYFAGQGAPNNPTSTLLEVNGTLYGTTIIGGNYGYGTVFAVPL